MIRLFNVHYPVRSLLLLAGEAVIVCASFLLVAVIRFQHDSYWALNHENGFYKILGATGLVLLCLHYFDLYNLQRLRSHAETCLRLLTVLGILSLLLAALGYFFPSLMIGRGVFLGGVLVMTMGLFAWRFAFTSLLQGS